MDERTAILAEQPDMLRSQSEFLLTFKVNSLMYNNFYMDKVSQKA